MSIYQSNISDTMRKKNASIWMINSLNSELTLRDYVIGQKSEMTLYQVLCLIQQLLEIVRRCHHAGVLHRNLHPNNILVKKNKDPTCRDEIKLILIGFDIAWVDSKELVITDEEDLQIILKQAKDPVDDSFCTLKRFLSLDSSQNQRRSPTIDSTAVCYIFFWLLTDRWPDRMHDTDIQPHYELQCQKKIKDKLGRNYTTIQMILLCLYYRRCSIREETM